MTQTTGAAIRSAFRLHGWLIVSSGAFVTCVIATALYLGAAPADFIPFILYSQSYNKYFLLFPLAIIAVYGVVCLPVLFAGGGVMAYVKDVDARIFAYLKSPQFWNAIAALIAMLTLSLFFCIAKSLIPHVVHYTWDPAFAVLDKAVHFGYYPHEFLVPLVERFSLYGFADYIYFLFFLLIVSANGYCLFFDRDQSRRLRYLWATWICWVVGGVFLAALFASTGPVFYQQFYNGPSPYSDFIAYLFKTAADHDLATTPFTAELYKWTTDDRVIDINAISAMPSMHVAIVTLVLCYVWNISKTLRYLVLIFLGLTVAATVYLGLHYAIDGYAGIALAAGIWAVVGKLRNQVGLRKTIC